MKIHSYSKLHTIKNLVNCLLHITFHPTHLLSKDWKWQSTGFANYIRPFCRCWWVSGKIRVWCKSKWTGTSGKPWLLAPDRSGSHDFIQQPTARSPHGRGACLERTQGGTSLKLSGTWALWDPQGMPFRREMFALNNFKIFLLSIEILSYLERENFLVFAKNIWHWGYSWCIVK